MQIAPGQPLDRSRQLVLVPDSGFGSWLAPAFLTIAAGLFLLPGFYALATRYWTTTQGAQGPIILITGLWALWFEYRRKARYVAPGKLDITWAWLAASLCFYVLARMVGMLALELLAAWSVLVATLYGCAGWRIVRSLGFPLLYLLCIIPLPYTLEVAVTGALKLAAAHWSVSLLAIWGFDAAYSGGMLYIDQYELVMEAACSGLNSVFSLTAIGLFYVYWQRRRSRLEAAILTAAIVPIAIAANVVRLLLLLLLVHFQGQQVLSTILHPAAGFLMFAVSLALLVALDLALPRSVRRHR